MAETLIDVRQIEPSRRHPLILGTFENLALSESIVLSNDHDPRPLFYQFNTMHPGAFDWTYLEEGPHLWRVRITKVNAAAREQGSCCGTCGG